jgi:hypothetical protein
MATPCFTDTVPQWLADEINKRREEAHDQYWLQLQREEIERHIEEAEFVRNYIAMNFPPILITRPRREIW